MASYYVQLPELRANAMADFSGLRSAIRGLGAQFDDERMRRERQEIGNAMAEARYGDAAKAAFRQGDLDTGLGIRRHEASLADGARKEEQQYAQRVGQYFQNFIEPERDATKRANLVNAWIGSHPAIAEKLTASGINPTDTEGVIRFVRAEATPFMTPKERADLARIEASTAAERARESNYLASAEAKRPQSVLDTLRDVPSKTEWESPRVQSIIQAAWGQPVPWERRGEFLQATGGSSFAGGDPFMPTTEEAELGITREMKVRAARSQKLGEMFGKKGEQKEGYLYDIDNGEVVQTPTTEKKQQLDKQKAQLDFYQGQLANAEKVLTNTNWFARTGGILLDAGEAGQAAADWQNAVLGLVYEKSGKQTAVAEMRQWLSTYGPKAGDSEWRVKQKLQRTRDFYKALTGEDMETRQEDPNKRRLYDKYGLE